MPNQRRHSEKFPPHDNDAEEATLGSLLIDGEAIHKVATVLSPEDFFDPRTRLVYESCYSLYKRTEAINQITVAQELNRQDRLESAGGPAYLAHLVSVVPTSFHVEHYGRIVQRLSIMRRLIDAAGKIAALGYQAGPDVENTYFKASELLETIRQKTLRGTSNRTLFSFTSLQDLLQEPPRDAKWLLEGVLPSEGLSIIAAKPKVGKSTFCRNLALKVSEGRTFLNIPTMRGVVLYLALEEKRSEVADHFRLMGGRTEPIYIYVGVAPANALTALAKAIGDTNAKLAIIDPIQRFARMADINDYSQISGVLEPILSLARETGCHISCVHHLGKQDRDEADDILGSTALLGAVDAAIILKKKDGIRTVESYQRYGKNLERTILMFNPESGTIDASKTVEQVEMEKTAEAILEVLGDEELSEKEIRDAVGGNTGLTGKALRALLAEQKVAREGDGRKGSPFKYKKSLFLVSTIYSNKLETSSEAIISAHSQGRDDGVVFEGGKAKLCYSCFGNKWWIRDGELLCVNCHPNHRAEVKPDGCP